MYIYRLLGVLLGGIWLCGSVIGQGNPAFYPIKTNGKWGFMNRSGQVVVPLDYDHVGHFEGRYAVVECANRVGVIDTLGQEVTPCRYSLVDILNDSILLVRDGEEWLVQSYDGSRVYLRGITGDIQLLQNQYVIYEQITGVGLAHLHKGVITEANYTRIIASADAANTFITEKGDKKGLLRGDGTVLFEPKYEVIQNQFNYFVVKADDSEWGLADSEGNWVFHPHYQKITVLSNHFAMTHEKGKKDLFCLSQKKLLEKEITWATLFADRPAQIKVNKGGYIGLADSTGRWLLPLKYEEIEPFSDQLYRVKDKEKWGLLNDQDQIILPIECDVIHALDRTVAVASLNDKQGVIKANGEWVLEPIHTELPLKNNTIYIKNKDNVMMTWEFDEAGNIIGENKYSNFKSIRVKDSGASNTSNRLNTTNTVAPDDYIINDSLAWSLDQRTRLWGIKNRQTKRWKLPPAYTYFRNYKDLGFSIVCFNKLEVGGALEFEGLEFSMDGVLGIVHNERAMPITRLEFLDIRISDITEKKLPVARCVFVGGKHGLIAKSGKILVTGYGFIGEFHEGKARACPKGTLLADINGRHPRHFGLFADYFRSLDAGRHSNSLNSPIIEDKLYQKGVIYCEEGKWGFIDTLAKLRIPAEYDYVDNYTENVVIVQKAGQWGMIDGENKTILEPKYDDLDFLGNTNQKLLLVAQHKPLLGAIDTNGKMAIPVRYERINPYQEGLAAVRRGEKWGFVDQQGQEVIPCQYRSVHAFSEGLAAVFQKGRWGFIDRTGSWAIQPKYSAVGRFADGMAWVRANKLLYINSVGQPAIEQEGFTKLHDFEDGIARVITRGGGGLLRADGTWLREPQKKWAAILPFDSMGIARVKVGKRYELLNRQGEQPSRKGYAEIRSFREGYAVIRPYHPNLNHDRNSNFGLIDTAGNMLIPPKYTWLGDVHEGRLWFKDNGRYGYLDPQGKVIVPAHLHKAGDFDHGKAIVYSTYNQSGVIDTSGNYLVRPLVNKIMALTEGVLLVKQAYDKFFYVHEDLKRLSSGNFNQAHAFRYGVAPVQIKKKWGLINEQGMKIGSHKYQQIQPYDDQGIAKVKVERWEGVVNLQGKIIIQPEYEYLHYEGNGVFRVECNDAIGYMDIQGNWIWEMKE